jgi:thiamine transport system substrate-binding protein
VPTRPLRGPFALIVVAALATACAGTTSTADPQATSAAPDGASTSPAPETSPTAPASTTAQPPASDSDLEGSTVTLVTHDSFAVSEQVIADFEADTGMTVEILRGGDAGAMVNQAILTAGDPQGDVLFGVDNTFLSRALDAEVFDPYAPPALDSVDPALIVDDQHRVTPIDTGDVCVNFDRSFFDEAGLAPPATLDDLADPAYDGMLVVQNPATSSPGLAFLLATVAAYGTDGYLDYWQRLVDNDVAVAAGWEDAYYGQFSGAAGSDGRRPLVVSYASSPAAEVFFAEEATDTAPTGVVTDSCFRQIEFAGVLAGTDNPDGARALVDFLLSPAFQADVPLQMFVHPARNDVELPDVFVEHAATPGDALMLGPPEIREGRDDWIDAWTSTVLR